MPSYPKGVPTDVSESVRKLNPHLYAGGAPAEPPFKRKPHGSNQTSRLPQNAEPQPDRDDEHLAEDAREATNKVRCLVRYTSYRTRLCDERNLYDKHFTDALTEAGILFDDSPAWCKVEVEQSEVAAPEMERTEIVITPLP